MAGRLNFAASTVFGRVGLAHLRPIYSRAHGCKRASGTELHPQLRRCLKWWITLLNTSDLQVSLPHKRQSREKFILYTDATGNGSLGFALYDHKGQCTSWAPGSTPSWLNRRLKTRKNQVNAHELIAPLWAAEALMPDLKGAHVDLYIDNTAAEGIIKKGASKHPDLNSIAGTLWLLAADLALSLRVCRVPSDLNPADPPSRGREPPGASTRNLNLRAQGVRPLRL